MHRHRNDLPVEGALPSFDGATTWMNAAPLMPEHLRGSVVLVSFGTYTCINWIRSLPYVRAWATTYSVNGLQVVGVQTPEFDFEADLDNVDRALKEMDVHYPVAVDNDYSVWRAFDNHYWPALYFVDARGRIRHHHFGEGDDKASEMVLQELLRESGEEVDRGFVRIHPDGVEAVADWANLGSPETYVGHERTVGFASPGGVVPEEPRVYSAPARLRRNHWSLSGTWRIGSVAAVLDDAGGSIAYRFHARDLHLVMGPPKGRPPVHFRVRLDGEPPGHAHGIDIDATGSGTADDQRMYQLIRQSAPIEERHFEIEFLDAGVEAYVFTFG
jgi:hypothetical protein